MVSQKHLKSYFQFLLQWQHFRIMSHVITGIHFQFFSYLKLLQKLSNTFVLIYTQGSNILSNDCWELAAELPRLLHTNKGTAPPASMTLSGESNSML